MIFVFRRSHVLATFVSLLMWAAIFGCALALV